MKDFFIKLKNKRIAIYWAIVFICAISSFIRYSPVNSVDKAVKDLQERIHKRQQILEDYAKIALETPDSVFLSFKDFPEDMVIYRYYQDTLQSWVNRLPISNDDDVYFSLGYRLQHVNSGSVSNTPLAYAFYSALINNNPGEEQYLSLGSGWYVVKMYIKKDMLIITALLVQTDYPTENSMLKNLINPNLSPKKRLSIVPVTYDESYVIHGKDGGVLFSVLKDLPSKGEQSGSLLRLIAIIFIVFALFARLKSTKKIKDFFYLAGGLIAVSFFALYMSSRMQGGLALFSPTLYADFELFSSLADLLIINLFITLIITALFIMRKTLALIVIKSKGRKRSLLKTAFIIIPLLLLPYIHISLRSVILNSSVVLELYRVDGITVYSLLVYFSYALLFIALLFSLQLLRPLSGHLEKFSFLKTRNLAIYIICISFYTLGVVSFYGFKKEDNRNRVWANKLSTERDLNIELQLKTIEKQIESDPQLRMYVNAIGGDDLVHSQLSENYFWNILQRYDMNIKICRELSQLQLGPDSPLLLCNSFFENEVARYGSQLYESSRFFFMNNFNGRVRYLGIFTYPPIGNKEGPVRLYIELDSKFTNETIGYPPELLNHMQMDNFTIPYIYSYGKYLNDRLVLSNGDYSYPIVSKKYDKIGYYTSKSDGYLHFISRVTPETTIILSRPERNIFPYFVSLSYTMLFYFLIIFGLIGRGPKGSLASMPRNSFRWKISILLLSSLVIALVFMGTGSVWFSINYFNENTKSQLQEKMASVQSTLSFYSQNVGMYNDPRFNNMQLQQAMNRVSNNARIDVNLYSSSGFLLRTTQPEIFNRFIVGKRMNDKAFIEMVKNNKKEFVHKEKIAGVEYNSLYAPLYNQDGVLIAIINIPYFSQWTGMRSDVSNIIATIINIYILLLLAAVFGGIALSNSLSKPLAEISKKMELLDISQKPEHIDYTNKDELGILVSAYNKMVDDLEESTKRLTAGEREQAWREMARQIAHEIKNPLTPMRLSIQHLVRMKSQGVPDWPNKFDALANSLIEQIDILSETAGEFSSYSRFYSEELRPVELNTLIREQILLFNTRDNIQIKFDSDQERAEIIARKTQLTRVLVNLLSNAIQAMTHLESGKICVSLRKENDFYEISVEDSGPGVPDNLTHRLFKPNFTTKSGGTGLGLAICRSIIEQSQGEISYSKSELLGGARFNMKLPISGEGISV